MKYEPSITSYIILNFLFNNELLYWCIYFYSKFYSEIVALSSSFCVRSALLSTFISWSVSWYRISLYVVVLLLSYLWYMLIFLHLVICTYSCIIQIPLFSQVIILPNDNIIDYASKIFVYWLTKGVIFDIVFNWNHSF